MTGRYGTLGQVFYVEEDFWPLNTTLYVRDFKGNDERFISYFLRSIDFLAYADKAAVPGLNRNHLHQAKVRVPADVSEQRAIASVLAALDDKIELNRHMSKTLQAIGRALFKSWFVDFDPVRAKVEGRGSRLPGALDELVPFSFVQSDIGMSPTGWKVCPLSEQTDLERGISYKGSGLSGHGMPMHNLNSVEEGGGYKYGGIKHYVGDFRERHRVSPGDCIVVNTEQGRDRMLIGHAAIVPTTFGAEGLFSHHLYRIRPKASSPLTPQYLCHLLNDAWMHDIVSGYSNGTTVNMLPADALKSPVVAVPPTGLVRAFDDLARDVQERVELTMGESTTLAQLRDTLLPKLISGELRVSEAERIVAEAGE